MTTLRTGDTDVELIVEIQNRNCVTGLLEALDLSTQTSMIICIRRPDATVVSRTASFTASPCGAGDGTDGKISIVTLATDLNQAGTYHLEGNVTLTGPPALGPVYSAPVAFQVTARICP